MQKVRIGIIGIGGRGSSHARYFVAGDIPDGELTAVCDIDPSRIQWARENLGESVRTFDDGDDLINSGAVDAIIVATPHYDHPTDAIKAFSKDLHVLIEWFGMGQSPQYVIASVFGIALATGWNFLGAKLLVFAERP